MSIDVRETAEVLDEMAADFARASRNMERLATQMRERDDMSYAADAMTEVRNTFANLRTDLLVTRPIRAYESSRTK